MSEVEGIKRRSRRLAEQSTPSAGTDAEDTPSRTRTRHITRNLREQDEDEAEGGKDKKNKNSVVSHGTQEKLLAFIKLARPKFLYYSATLHLAGILLACSMKHHENDAPWYTLVDWKLFLYTQLTISVTHLCTHFWNEWADFEVDCLNQNAGAWTGGSKVLKQGLLQRNVAKTAGLVSLFVSLACGTNTIAHLMYTKLGVSVPGFFVKLVQVMQGTDPDFGDMYSFLTTMWPMEFIWIGISVLFVSIAYSVNPLRLSARGLGELCVSYVLTFAAPAIGTCIFIYIYAIHNWHTYIHCICQKKKNEKYYISNHNPKP